MRTIQDIQGQPISQKLLLAYLEKGPPPLMIFHGPDGTGRWSATEAFVAQFLCEVKTVCGNCKTCKKIQAKMHADIIQFPDDKILIGNKENPETFTIRWLLRKKIRYTPYDGNFRFVIMPRADLIQNEAETALLKTLEEAPDHTRFIFITPDIESLKPTIRSRGVLIPFHRFSDQDLQKLTNLQLGQDELDYLGGNLQYLSLMQSEFYRVVKEKISETLRHPLSLLDFEAWIQNASKSGFLEKSDLDDDFSYDELIDFIGLQFLILTKNHPKRSEIAYEVLGFKKWFNNTVIGLNPYILGKLFNNLNSLIHGSSQHQAL